MPDDEIRLPINHIRQEEGAHELATSRGMRPYIEFAMAIMKGTIPTVELEAIRALPLKERYVWRVASALKWGFADFDDLSVTAHKDTLSEEDLGRVMDLLKLRPLQFCMFLKALVGAEEMQKMMVEAIRMARDV